MEERPRMESSPKERITGQASAHTSERMRSIGGRVIATLPWTSGVTSGIASRKSDMTSNSYASLRRGSQWSVRATAMYARFRHIVRTREIRYMSMPRIGGGDEAGKFSDHRIVTERRTVAPRIVEPRAATDLRRDLCCRGTRVLVSAWC